MSTFRFKDENNPEKGSLARSFSGHERNRMFLQTDDNFEDVSLVSGADTRNDGRGFVLFDFDRDGWLDMGVTSPLTPKFRILKNAIAEVEQSIPNKSAFLTLVGGSQVAAGQTEWSSRDPIGAKLLVTIGQTKRMYQVSCGEGLASQNSKWIHIGLGLAEKIDRVEVSWPSGKKTSHVDVVAGSRVTFYEDDRMAE